MISASGETYDLFSNAFGRDSFDAAGGIMDSIFNRGNSCPNASWNGVFISFCPGTTSDDVTAHEWGHAYTEYTDGLIYQWQPGALNEAASDIYGETVDRINGRGTDSPDAARTGQMKVDIYPTPSSAETLYFDCLIPQDALAVSGTADSTEVTLEPTVIIYGAWSKAISERGEDGGALFEEISGMYRRALADAISYDAALHMSPETD